MKYNVGEDYNETVKLSKRRKVGRRKNSEEPGPGEGTQANKVVDEIDHALQQVIQKMNKYKKSKTGDKPVLMWNVWEEEHEKWIDENISKDFDLENQNALVTEAAEAPSDVIMDLLRYQKEWLAWALKQEDSVSRGGILADEMGMGKTIQAIALVLAKREFCRATGEEFETSLSLGSSTGLPQIKGTLVICPVVAVSQWVSEIDRFTSKGSTKVLVYHGANREKNFKQFSEYDFVITTYSIVEAEYRKYMLPPKERCSYCGKMFYEKKMSIHLRYYCGPGALKTEKQSKQQKKKSKSMPSTSKSDIKSPKHKATKKNEKEAMAATVKFAAQALPRGKSLLHAVKWNRIILDEVILHNAIYVD